MKKLDVIFKGLANAIKFIVLSGFAIFLLTLLIKFYYLVVVSAWNL